MLLEYKQVTDGYFVCWLWKDDSLVHTGFLKQTPHFIVSGNMFYSVSRPQENFEFHLNSSYQLHFRKILSAKKLLLAIWETQKFEKAIIPLTFMLWKTTVLYGDMKGEINHQFAHYVVLQNKIILKKKNFLNRCCQEIIWVVIFLFKY